MSKNFIYQYFNISGKICVSGLRKTNFWMPFYQPILVNSLSQERYELHTSFWYVLMSAVGTHETFGADPSNVRLYIRSSINRPRRYTRMQIPQKRNWMIYVTDYWNSGNELFACLVDKDHDISKSHFEINIWNLVCRWHMSLTQNMKLLVWIKSRISKDMWCLHQFIYHIYVILICRCEIENNNPTFHIFHLATSPSLALFVHFLSTRPIWIPFCFQFGCRMGCHL